MIGRDRELAYLSAFLDAAATRPMVLALLGEAGIGKTTLLDALAGQARSRGFRVVRLSRGDAVLRRLGGALNHSAGLTRLVLALDRLAATAPVLFLIDRADHADPAARRLLTLLIRHLSTERVSFVLAARGDEPPAGIAPEINRLLVSPLGGQNAAALLRKLSGGPRQTILRQAAGNPLALAGGCLPAEDVRVLGRLPTVTRWLLAHAAFAGEAELVDVITRAAGGPGDLSGWEPAERAGLITIADGRVSFTHPLIRDHLIASVVARQARLIRAALAVCTADPCRRAMHRGASAAPDEQMAAAIEQGSADAAPLDQAQALEAAASLSPGDADAARRLVGAVSAACHAGEPAWAIELSDRVAALTADPDLLGSAAAGAGLALTQMARPTQAFELLLRAVARDPHDRRVTATLVCMAATAVLISGDSEHRGRLRELLAGLDDDGLLSPAARTFVRSVAETAGHPDPVDLPGGAEPMLFSGAVSWMRDDTVRAISQLHIGWRAQQRSGIPGTVIAQVPQLVLALMDSGRWREAAELMDDVEHLAAVSGATLLTTVLPSLRMTLRVWQGARLPFDAPEPPAGNGLAAALHHRAAGLALLTTGDFEAAYEHFRAAFDDAGNPVHPTLSPLVLPLLAFTAVRIGQVHRVSSIVYAFRRPGGLTARRQMLLDHATALLEDSEEHFRRATGDPDRALLWPLEYAEAQLSQGLWLRRQRRVQEALPYLRGALDTFQRLGADAHAEQTRKYVPGLGGQAAVDAFAALPAQKQRIARMAADGLRNAEIAQRLKVSPRTVSSHLYGMFPQLGVANRHQLRSLLTSTGRTV